MVKTVRQRSCSRLSSKCRNDWETVAQSTGSAGFLWSWLKVSLAGGAVQNHAAGSILADVAGAGAPVLFPVGVPVGAMRGVSSAADLQAPLPQFTSSRRSVAVGVRRSSTTARLGLSIGSGGCCISSINAAMRAARSWSSGKENLAAAVVSRLTRTVTRLTLVLCNLFYRAQPR
jgi:hypothetical protein